MNMNYSDGYEKGKIFSAIEIKRLKKEIVNLKVDRHLSEQKIRALQRDVIRLGRQPDENAAAALRLQAYVSLYKQVLRFCNYIKGADSTETVEGRIMEGAFDIANRIKILKAGE